MAKIPLEYGWFRSGAYGRRTRTRAHRSEIERPVRRNFRIEPGSTGVWRTRFVPSPVNVWYKWHLNFLPGGGLSVKTFENEGLLDDHLKEKVRWPYADLPPHPLIFAYPHPGDFTEPILVRSPSSKVRAK